MAEKEHTHTHKELLERNKYSIDHVLQCMCVGCELCVEQPVGSNMKQNKVEEIY